MNLLIFVTILLLAEVFESWWQYAPTLEGVLYKMSHYAQRNIFMLFCMYPSFYFLLFIFVLQGYQGTLLSLMIVMKASDIVTKLWMMKKMNEKELPQEFQMILRMPLSFWMQWINVIIYPLLLLIALG